MYMHTAAGKITHQPLLLLRFGSSTRRIESNRTTFLKTLIDEPELEVLAFVLSEACLRTDATTDATTTSPPTGDTTTITIVVAGRVAEEAPFCAASCSKLLTIEGVSCRALAIRYGADACHI